MWPRFWGASTKRCKDAGSVDSFTIGATEDAAARCVIAPQKPGGHCLGGHLSGFLGFGLAREEAVPASRDRVVVMALECRAVVVRHHLDEAGLRVLPVGEDALGER